MGKFSDKAKDIVTYPWRQDGLPEAIANSSLLPFNRHAEIAAIPEAEKTPEEIAELDALSAQTDKILDSPKGTLSVIAGRAKDGLVDVAKDVSTDLVDKAKGAATDFVDKAIDKAKGAAEEFAQPYVDKYIKPVQSIVGFLGMLADNWQLIAAALVGASSLFMGGGFMGTATLVAGAGLAANHFVEQATGKGLLEHAFDLVDKVSEKFADRSPQPALAHAVNVSTARNAGQVPAPEFQPDQRIPYRTDWAATKSTGNKKQSWAKDVVDDKAAKINTKLEI